MRVLLLNPPPAGGVNVVREGRCMQRTGAWTSVWAPVTLATTAAVLRDDGFEVMIYDGSVEDPAGFEPLVAGFMPELTVINTATPSIAGDIGIADRIKALAPGAGTLAVGIHASALPDDCFAIDAALDMLARGEPELTVLEAVRALDRESGLGDVAGLSWRDGGEVRHNPDRPFLDDLDRLPFPAWDLVDTNLYRLPFSSRRFLLVASARGCPHGCTFCANKAYYGARLRKRSPERIVDEMAWAAAEFGISDFLIWSESFTNDQDFALRTAAEISRRGLGIRWVCNSRVDTVSPELLFAIRQAGCWMIGYGIESGNQAVLDSVRKGTTLADAEQAVRLARDAGLQVTGHCVLGFPGETEETMQQTIDFACRLKLDYAQFYCAVAFPGSDLFDQCRESGWLDSLDWPRYEQNISVITTPQLSAGQVMAARQRAYRRFYRQPHVVLNSLRQARHGGVRSFGRMVRDFLTWV